MRGIRLSRLSRSGFRHPDGTGVETLDPAREFPVDSAAGDGFMNVGQSLVMSPSLVTKYLDAAKVEANKAIAEAQALAAAEGVAAETRVIEAQRTWRGIIDAADTLHADAIVMGSHGRTGLDKLVMGSVTQRVMQHTHLLMLWLGPAANA